MQAQGSRDQSYASPSAEKGLQGMAGMPGGARANGKDVTLRDADAELDFREGGARLASTCAWADAGLVERGLGHE